MESVFKRHSKEFAGKRLTYARVEGVTRMGEQPQSEKAEENAKPKRRRRPLEYRRFEKLLKQEHP
jgi:hypothetical protein